ncbi:MAG: hypothetical protein CMA27_06050 [Euryarchaeota archaeon]|nr:hypothetical protein [Euryarchaeota archaeon]|tara:strand:- start:944 stop:1162 length:219 start_codon:yes stop_codon:yes gene_type:complete
MIQMVERFLPSNDPIKEDVLEWTVKRDAADAKKLLDWLSETQSYREKKAMILLIQELVEELKMAVDELSDLK